MPAHVWKSGVCENCKVRSGNTDIEKANCPGTDDRKKALVGAVSDDGTLVLHSCKTGGVYKWQEVIGGPVNDPRWILQGYDEVCTYKGVEAVEWVGGDVRIWTKGTVFYHGNRSDHHYRLPRDPGEGATVVHMVSRVCEVG